MFSVDLSLLKLGQAGVDPPERIKMEGWRLGTLDDGHWGHLIWTLPRALGLWRKVPERQGGGRFA